MPTIPEQLGSAAKSNAEAQHAVGAALGEKLFERLEELSRLNIDVVKSTLAESMAITRDLLHAKDPQEFSTANATYLKREIQSTIFYSSEVMRIVSAALAEFNKAAAEGISEASRQGTVLLTGLTQTVPVGTEQMADIFKSAWATAGAASPASRKKNSEQAARTTH